MLDDILATLRECHREAHRRARFEVQLVREDLRGAHLQPLDDVVHVLALRHARDLEKYVALAGRPRTGDIPLHVEHFLGVAEEAGARPVRDLVRIFRRKERGLREARLREREQRREAERRREGAMPRVDDHLFFRRMRRQLIEHELERLVVQRRRNGDDGSHDGLSSPLK
jgi:hypothetical protein